MQFSLEEVLALVSLYEAAEFTCEHNWVKKVLKDKLFGEEPSWETLESLMSKVKKLNS